MAKRTIYKNEEGKHSISQHYDNYLNTFNQHVERVVIQTSFGKTHLLAAGPKEGKPLFIFQGGNCINPMTLSWFSPLMDKYRIYAPDTIGHPGYSDENRMSARDASFAQWITELMDYLNIESSAFIGPSYGAGIILRLAAFKPERVSCSILVSPAGITLGSKIKMIREILCPLLFYKLTTSEKYLNKLTGNMSDYSMLEIDRKIIGDIFKYVKLEQEMPKLTEKNELSNYNSPTLVIAGKRDVFFPASKLEKTVHEIIPNLVAFKTYDMGHFPSKDDLIEINNEIEDFLKEHY